MRVALQSVRACRGAHLGGSERRGWKDPPRPEWDQGAYHGIPFG